MNIALVFNKKRDAPKDKPKDFYAEFDSEETINDLKRAIEADGHDVILIEADEEAYIKLKDSKNKIDFVFNFAEGIKGESRESQIPIFCELLGIPYLGCSPLSSAIILNKARTKEIACYHNIPTPRFKVLADEDEKVSGLKFPLLVKPIAEGSSKGLKNENLVKDDEQLRRIVKKIREDYRQKAIAEEFLEGREFTVSIIGNEKPFILPIVEVKFDHLPEELHRFDHYEAKWVYDSPEYIDKHKINPVVCPAEIAPELEKSIKETALKTFKVLDCKDWARVDIRLDSKGIPNMIEVNSPVGLIKNPKENSRMPRSAYAYGWSYERLVKEILDSGLRRYNLK